MCWVRTCSRGRPKARILVINGKYLKLLNALPFVLRILWRRTIAECITLGAYLSGLDISSAFLFFFFCNLNSFIINCCLITQKRVFFIISCIVIFLSNTETVLHSSGLVRHTIKSIIYVPHTGNRSRKAYHINLPSVNSSDTSHVICISTTLPAVASNSCSSKRLFRASLDSFCSPNIIPWASSIKTVYEKNIHTGYT